MTDTSGFYRWDGEQLLHAPNAVYAPDFTLLRAEREQYQYPVGGWQWFDNVAAATTALKP